MEAIKQHRCLLLISTHSFSIIQGTLGNFSSSVFYRIPFHAGHHLVAPHQDITICHIPMAEWSSTAFLCTSRNHSVDLKELLALYEMISSPFPGLDHQERAPENKKRYSEIFRSLDAIEISIGNAYVEKEGQNPTFGSLKPSSVAGTDGFSDLSQPL